MKSVAPAEVRSEPATLPGMPFMEATGRACVWPLSGSGAEMVCCGGRRKPGRPYCDDHCEIAGGAGAPVKPRLPRV